MPYDRSSELDKMLAHIHDPPPSVLDAAPELPPQLAQVVRRALAKYPGDRQQTAGALADEALAAVQR